MEMMRIRDESIQQEIYKRPETDERLDGKSIAVFVKEGAEVSVKDGIARLSGVVSSRLIRDEILKISSLERGILDVDDEELTIG